MTNNNETLDNLYNITAERLWEKLEFYKNRLNVNVDYKKPFPIDQLTFLNPDFDVMKLVDEVQKEFNYEMSEYQCSWAVRQMTSKTTMEEYNNAQKTSLSPRE